MDGEVEVSPGDDPLLLKGLEIVEKVRDYPNVVSSRVGRRPGLGHLGDRSSGSSSAPFLSTAKESPSDHQLELDCPASGDEYCEPGLGLASDDDTEVEDDVMEERDDTFLHVLSRRNVPSYSADTQIAASSSLSGGSPNNRHSDSPRPDKTSRNPGSDSGILKDKEASSDAVIHEFAEIPEPATELASPQLWIANVEHFTPLSGAHCTIQARDALDEEHSTGEMRDAVEHMQRRSPISSAPLGETENNNDSEDVTQEAEDGKWDSLINDCALEHDSFGVECEREPKVELDTLAEVRVRVYHASGEPIVERCGKEGTPLLAITIGPTQAPAQCPIEQQNGPRDAVGVTEEEQQHQGDITVEAESGQWSLSEHDSEFSIRKASPDITLPNEATRTSENSEDKSSDVRTRTGSEGERACQLDEPAEKIIIKIIHRGVIKTEREKAEQAQTSPIDTSTKHISSRAGSPSASLLLYPSISNLPVLSSTAPATSVLVPPMTVHSAPVQQEIRPQNSQSIEAVLRRRTSSNLGRTSSLLSQGINTTAADVRINSKIRKSLHDELISVTSDTSSHRGDEGDESMRSIVEVSSQDPRAAARAVAILKLVCHSTD